ncbi:MAG: beta-lactamase family protein [Chloroflexi bacterium]|nr:beta-lactamase family protein [Chloroflexota bacterium]
MQSVTFKTLKPITLITLILAALFLLFQPGSVQAEAMQLAPPMQVGVIDPVELEAFMDAYLAEQMAEHHIPGAVITVVKDGNVFFSKGYGYADLENQIPFDPAQTVLTTASLGKVFTAVGVLQLYQQGAIDLHENIRPYITKFQLATNFDEPLTFANLLTHTDGFEARMIGVAAQTADEMLPLGQALETYAPTQLYPPGEYMTYGDYAASMAGYLTQEVSGLPFEKYMTDNILSPLGMTDSAFDQHLSDEMSARLAVGYEYDENEGQHHPAPIFYIQYAPAGGLRTTAADMNPFILALLNGGEYQGARILNEESIQMMHTQQFAPDPKMAGITYGLFEHFENGQRVLLRDGDGVGTRSRMVLFPDQDMGFFISYNSGDSNLRLDVVSAFLDRYYPASDANAPVPMANYQQRVGQFAGTYRPLQADATSFGKSMYFFSQLVEARVTDEGYLSIVAAGMGGEQSSVMGGFEGTSLWVEVEPLHFEQVDGKGQLAFVQDESGDIVQMISGQGYHSAFAKLPWYESQSFHMVLIELVVLLLVTAVISTFVIWPLGGLIHKLRRQYTSEPISWGTVAARLWMGLVAGVLALFVFRAIGVLYAIDAVAGMPNFVWGVSEEMISALNSIYLPVFLAFALPIFTILAWVNQWWKLPIRIHYTLVTLAVFSGIWWTWYWNLLGFQM